MIMVTFDLLYNADAHFVCLSRKMITTSLAECLSVCLSRFTLTFLSLVCVCLSATFYHHLLERSACLFVCHVLPSLFSLVSVCLSLTFSPHFLEPSVYLFVCHILSVLSWTECLSVCLSSFTLAFLSLVSVCLSLTFYPYLPLFHQDRVWYLFCDLYMIGCVCLSVCCVLCLLFWVMCLPSWAPESREARRW